MKLKKLNNLKLRTKKIGAFIVIVSMLSVGVSGVIADITYKYGNDGSDDWFGPIDVITTSLDKCWEATAANLQTAFDAVDTAGGGWVEIPSIIEVSTPRLIGNNTWFRGGGNHTGLKLADYVTIGSNTSNISLLVNSGHYLFGNHTNHNIRVSNMVIDGNGYKQTIPANYYVHRNSIEFVQVNNCTIFDVLVENTIASGIRMRYGEDNLVTNCWVYGAGVNLSANSVTPAINTFGIYLQGELRSRVSNCRITNAYSDGIVVELDNYCDAHWGATERYADSCIVENCIINNCFNGIWVENCYNITIDSNICYNNTEWTGHDPYAPWAGQSSGICVGCNSFYIIISNNICYHNGNFTVGAGEGVGIYCGGEFVTLTNNIVHNNSQWGYAIHENNVTMSNCQSYNDYRGIYIASYGKHILINNCAIIDAQEDGITCDTTNEFVTISNCHVVSPGDDGIVGGADYSKIIGCTVVEAGGYPISVKDFGMVKDNFIYCNSVGNAGIFSYDDNVTIQGNYISDANNYAIRLTGNYPMVKDNEIHGGGTGISITKANSTGGIISDNYFYGSDYPIKTTTLSTYSINATKISGNLITGASVGIYIHAYNCSITDNTILDSVTLNDGIKEVEQSDYNFFDGNHFVNVADEFTIIGSHSSFGCNVMDGIIECAMPTTIPTETLINGSWYCNTTTGDIRTYDGSAWHWNN